MSRIRTLSLHILFTVTFFFFSISTADEFEDAAPLPHPRSAILYAWPLTSPSPFQLAKVAYTPKKRDGSYQLISSNELGGLNDDELVKVGVWDENRKDKKEWFGSVTTGKSIKNGSAMVRVDGEGEIWHVEYSGELKSSPTTIVLKSSPGATPTLNRPVVLSPDGKVPVQEPEKTFFQKYWWLIIGAAVLLLSGGGGGGE